MADQWVGRQAVRSPLAQVPVRSCHGRHCKALLVLLQQQSCHLHPCTTPCTLDSGTLEVSPATVAGLMIVS